MRTSNHGDRRRCTYTEFFARRSSRFLIAFGVLQLVLVTIAKGLSGSQVAFSAIYLIPVSFMTWFVSVRGAVFSASGSALALLLINLADRSYYSHPAIPYWNAGMDFVVFLFAIYTLSEVKSLYMRERELSREDPLTGLANRRAFFETVTNEAVRARRYAHPLTLVYLDVDDFKQLNETYGHGGGDHVLAAVGEAIRNSVREVDSAARLGGDEFAVLLPETDGDAARLVVEKLQAGLHRELDAQGWPVSFSIGAATFSSPRLAEQMIQAADELMYTVKHAGKNRFAQKVL